MSGSSVMFRLSNHFRFGLHYLEGPGWQLFERVPLIFYSGFGSWNLHQLFDGDGFVYQAAGFDAVVLLVPSCR